MRRGDGEGKPIRWNAMKRRDLKKEAEDLRAQMS